MTKRYQVVTSGPSRLIWERTGFPVVPNAEPDIGLTYHLASRIEEHTIDNRPEDDVAFDKAVGTITDLVAHPRRTLGAGLTSIPLDLRSEELPEFVNARQSNRTYSGKPVAIQTLANVLRFGLGAQQGVGTERPRRTVASAGGLGCIDTYVIALNFEGLRQGVYFVDGDAGSLRFCHDDDIVERSLGLQFTIKQAEVSKAAGIIALVFVSERVLWKYGSRSYRFGCLEAGHLMHAFSLGASSAGLNFCPIGGFCDTKLDTLLGVDGVHEVSLYMATLGSRPSDECSVHD